MCKNSFAKECREIIYLTKEILLPHSVPGYENSTLLNYEYYYSWNFLYYWFLWNINYTLVCPDNLYVETYPNRACWKKFFNFLKIFFDICCLFWLTSCCRLIIGTKCWKKVEDFLQQAQFGLSLNQWGQNEIFSSEAQKFSPFFQPKLWKISLLLNLCILVTLVLPSMVLKKNCKISLFSLNILVYYI